ncbi:MAG: hypothetical protein COA71_01510 [SAR86 cluster bacterium]|uniref:Uncharacterized protein n=1 Tax=SAR86 cluster bacterium TaxID=2030880 RepID=A0A2A5CJN0_9GAMM|nr:MAG: hypothetical protein COA71_01510 [SAR86 cluster bacterium]
MRKILFYLHRLATLLKPVRIILVILTLFALLLTAYSLLVQTRFTLNALEPSIVVSLWGMLLLASTELFQKLPDSVLPKDSFLQRAQTHCKHLFFTFLALIVLFVAALLIWLSLRLLLI